MEKKSAAILLGMLPDGSIIRHFAIFTRAMKAFADESGLDYFFGATSKMRQDDTTRIDAWSIVHSVLQDDHILTGDTYADVIDGVRRVLESHERTVVHFQGGWRQLRYLIPLKREYGSRMRLLAVTQAYKHDTRLRIPMSAFQCLLYTLYADKVNFQCPYSARRFVGNSLIFRQGKGVILPMWCEPYGEIPEDVPAGIKGIGLEKVLLDKSLYTFVYLAGFRPGKKHRWLVEAIAPVLKTMPHVRILFCGSGDVNVKRDVEQTINRLGVGTQVLLPGQIPHEEVPWLLKHSGCAIIPTAAETFGHTYVEPLMAGIPVLGTRTGAGEYAIRDYETGFGFDLNAPESVRAGVRALAGNPEESLRMGERARELAERIFLTPKVVRGYCALYRDMLRS